jgi:hypothetical protein
VRIKTVVLALSMLLLAAGSAEAHELSMETARQKLRQQAVTECKGNCTAITINRCRHRTLHRVSCHGRATFRNGKVCTWTGIAIASHRTSKIRLLPRDVVCRKP